MEHAPAADTGALERASNQGGLGVGLGWRTSDEMFGLCRSRHNTTAPAFLNASATRFSIQDGKETAPCCVHGIHGPACRQRISRAWVSPSTSVWRADDGSSSPPHSCPFAPVRPAWLGYRPLDSAMKPTPAASPRHLMAEGFVGVGRVPAADRGIFSRHLGATCGDRGVIPHGRLDQVRLDSITLSCTDAAVWPVPWRTTARCPAILWIRPSTLATPMCLDSPG
ncbi:hypothetical protein FQR65_LT18797 [Abscondita terminalis]|nr:hypothetical protein FQR65_LT18797 [Abscondita terminalis]